MEYVCIESFTIPICDEDGMPDNNKIFTVKKGTVWTLNSETNILGADIHLDDENLNWVEISNDTLAAKFKNNKQIKMQ